MFYQNNFTSNGGRNATSDMLVDGVSATGYEQNTAIQIPLYMPSVDAVQEFKVQQNSFGADIGYSSNTVLNVVTRSGRNQLMDPCSSGPTAWSQRAIALNEAQTFSPSMVLTLAYGFARQLVNQPGAAANFPSFNPITDLGLPSYMTDSGVKATPVIVVYGGYYQAGPLN